jgi:hypothetical protein
MAQQFTHLARPPQVSDSHPLQRYFKRSSNEDGDNATTVMRFAGRDTAEIDVGFYGPNLGQAVDVRTDLTADQCEHLARALLDAAHDLRTHSAQALEEARMVDEMPA